MGDRTVSFSAPMVLALLQGRKTQTRRLATSPLRRCAVGDRLTVREHWKTMAMHDALSPTAIGEKYARSIYPENERATPVLYLADNARRGRWAEDESAGWSPGKHRQAMHMPRWASRLSLVITGVRIEPLQAITEAGAETEGCVYETADPPFWYVPYIYPHSLTGVGIEQGAGFHAERCYGKLWDLLHTDEGQQWSDNPDVLVLTFDVEHTPIFE